MSLVILLICIQQIQAQTRDEEKYALQQLVDERETRFGEYSRAAAAKTGFFGNKSKNDLRKQVEVLTEIIKTDNRIISLLKNFLDYRKFEKTGLVYNQAELEAKNTRLNELVTSLSGKLKTSETKYRKAESSMNRWRLVAVILMLLLGWAFWKIRNLKQTLKNT